MQTGVYRHERAVDRGMADGRRKFQQYIDGEWSESSDSGTSNVDSPFTGLRIARVPKATVEDVKRALDAASEAQPSWEEIAPLKRAAYLLKIAELIRRDKERLARILTDEEGKPLLESRLEVEGSAENFEYYAQFARRIEGELLPGDFPKQSLMILRLPLGVVASITPWNFPSSTVARKIAPALITGNTVVTKPSSLTPLSTIELARLAAEAELPRGVLNVVTGSGADVGKELVSNSKTSLITMTGSVEVGEEVMRTASGHAPKLILELGGKAPFIVWSDAEMGWALRCAIWARFWNCGQTCISAERIYVDEKVRKRFVRAFVRRARDLRLGDPAQPDTDLGPMVSDEQRRKCLDFVKEAEDQGGRILTGGADKRESPKRGWFMRPTVIEGLPQDSRPVQEEIFGPVVPIIGVETFDQAIEYSNDSRYGLSSYVFTRDNRRIMQAIYGMKFGECYVNQVGPEQLQGAHTGFRESGVGAEGSRHGLECYTQLKTCYVDWDEAPGLPYLFPYGDRHGRKRPS